MKLRHVAILLLTVLTGACTLTPQQQERLERGSVPPGGVALPVSRSVGFDGVTCRYSDGSITRSGNVATSC